MRIAFLAETAAKAVLVYYRKRERLGDFFCGQQARSTPHGERCLLAHLRDETIGLGDRDLHRGDQAIDVGIDGIELATQRRDGPRI